MKIYGGWVVVAAVWIWLGVSGSSSAEEISSDVKKVPVVFSGGHETDPKDRGRPVILIANALGVAPEIFREAFSKVHPADSAKGPEPGQARDNKAVLMEALGKYGVTHERLDEVSNYYRYVESRGELWTHRAAVANALVKDGGITGYEIVSAGSGYSSPPVVTVPGFKDAKAVVELSFGKPLESNGSVSAIKVP